MRQTEAFFQDSIATFGYEGAKSIGETIVRALRMTESRLTFPFGVPGVGFQVLGREDMIVDGLHSNDGIRIAVCGDHSARRARLFLAQNIVHEFAHESHWQNIPTGDHDNWRGSTFAGIIKEGVAVCAERELLEGRVTLPSVGSRSSKIELTLIELMLGDVPERGRDDNAYLAYLFGDDGVFYDRGYVTGEYVVGRFMVDNGIELGEVMKTPLGIFRQFVEEKL